jgi:YesN/AraC family two-component response regulator
MIGSGFLSVDKNETAHKMEVMGKGAVKKDAIMERLCVYPQADEQQVKSLADMMLVCAESVSSENNDYYKTLKRRADQKKDMEEVLSKLKDGYERQDASGTAERITGYPQEKEAIFLETVRRGNAEKSIRMLNELAGFFIHNNPEQFKLLKIKILELAVMLSRIENSKNNVSNTYSAAAHQFIKSIQDAKTQDELIDIIHMMTRHFAGESKSFQGIRHSAALKKADRFIQANFSRKLSLKEIAAASGLSAPYFCTIFKEEMGENLSGYLNRLRIEKACRLLLDTNSSLNEISYSCGFEDQS